MIDHSSALLSSFYLLLVSIRRDSWSTSWIAYFCKRFSVWKCKLYTLKSFSTTKLSLSMSTLSSRPSQHLYVFNSQNGLQVCKQYISRNSHLDCSPRIFLCDSSILFFLPCNSSGFLVLPLLSKPHKAVKQCFPYQSFPSSDIHQKAFALIFVAAPKLFQVLTTSSNSWILEDCFSYGFFLVFFLTVSSHAYSSVWNDYI